MVTRGIHVLSSMIGAIFIALLMQVSAFATSNTEEPKGHKSESEKELPILDQLDPQSDSDDRLVILPEIKREGERFFLSSFKLPEKITFAGLPVPLDNWQVRERIEYEFYQFLEDQGESIILAKRTGRCFPPLRDSWLMPDCPMISSTCCWSRVNVSQRPIPRLKPRVPGSLFPPPAVAIGSRVTRYATSVGIWKCRPRQPSNTSSISNSTRTTIGS